MNIMVYDIKSKNTLETFSLTARLKVCEYLDLPN